MTPSPGPDPEPELASVSVSQTGQYKVTLTLRDSADFTGTVLGSTTDSDTWSVAPGNYYLFAAHQGMVSPQTCRVNNVQVNGTVVTNGGVTWTRYPVTIVSGSNTIVTYSMDM